jgi:ATP-dependent DNA helicase RecG
MSRLLEGDVGSGKTAVAAVASFAAVSTLPPSASRRSEFESLQVAYMAPTEILAEQHFESFIEYFSQKNMGVKISVGLITGSGAKKFPSKTNKEKWTKISKPQLLKWVANGEIPILIGTHALIQKSVKFKNLAFIVIDEQHRFGVKQRMQLRRKHDIAPHLLSMTATPIPRTLALTIFGDLDLSLLDELPPGRQIPETKIVLPHERDEIYARVREQLKTGRQAFVICPRINDPDPDKENVINAKSVKSETERLQKKIFPEFKVAAITGKLKPAEKEKIMKDFKNHKSDILVATSVVEVGVNVPNATVIIIENAERFGLAQLHQLRGRVLRSSFKPYCFVFADLPLRSFSESGQGKTISRLKSFANSSNGFELAEADLQQRGSGDLAGAKKWGVSDLAMEALKNIKMVEAARAEARSLIEFDPDLIKHPLLAHHISQKQAVHME